MTDKMVINELSKNIEQIKEARDMAMNIAAYGDQHGEAGNVAQLLDWLVGLVEAAPQAKAEWISVDDRLPEVGTKTSPAIASDWVLASYTFNGTHYVGEARYVAAPTPYWKSIQDDTIRVNHWLPMPKPPEQPEC